MKRLNHSNINDAELWQKLLNGQADALALIYQQHVDLLSAYGFKLTKNKEIVNDAIQDVFINLWQKRHQLPMVISIKAYLLKSLRNRILRILESRTLSGHGDQPNEAIQDSFEQRLVLEELAAERVHQLHLNIQKLPARQKEVIHLRYFQNLNTEEIAEVLNINYQSVSNLIHKGIKTLRKHIHLPNKI